MAKTAQIDLPITERPEVLELRTQLASAEAELRAAQEELDHLNSILNPLPTTATHAPTLDALDILRAQQQLPFARERFLSAKAAVLELKPRYEAAHSDALLVLTAARNRARLLILRRFADALEEARVVGEELLAFDQETCRLGGSNPGHPFAQLLDDAPYRQGEATRVRQLVEQLDALS